MGGRGPTPKDPSQRARGNRAAPSTRLSFSKHDPGDLPAGMEWHPQTVRLWDAWRRSPMAELMSEVDWAHMLDTMLMHNAMWSKGRWEFAAEVRLRLAAFGATPADRMRLRIVWADADKRDATIPQMASVPASRARYSGLSAVPATVTPIRVSEPEPADGDLAGDGPADESEPEDQPDHEPEDGPLTGA